MPRGQRCSPRSEPLPDRALAASQRTSPFPRQPSHRRGVLNEASTKGSHVFARPVFPSLWPPGWNGPPLGFIPWASHPADQEPDDARQSGDRPSSTDLELLAQLTIVDLQSSSSLVTCDLASHVAKHSSETAGARDPLVANSIGPRCGGLEGEYDRPPKGRASAPPGLRRRWTWMAVVASKSGRAPSTAPSPDHCSRSSWLRQRPSIRTGTACGAAVAGRGRRAALRRAATGGRAGW